MVERLLEPGQRIKCAFLKAPWFGKKDNHVVMQIIYTDTDFVQSLAPFVI